MTRAVSRRPPLLAPSAVSAALLVAGVLVTAGSLWPTGSRPTPEAVLNPYQLASWAGSDDGRSGLASLLYLGRILGPMLVFAALAHARLGARELEELSANASPELDALPLATEGTTLRRISLVLPRERARRLEDALTAEPAHAHRVLPALAEAMREAGRIEHVERAVPGEGPELATALEGERRALARRIEPEAAAGYREGERATTAADGDHCVVSWVIVTRTDLDPWVDVPSAAQAARWLEELVPLRPEDTLALAAFVTPQGRGLDEATLASRLDLEPLDRGARAA
jgi:hypothetical protein